MALYAAKDLRKVLEFYRAISPPLPRINAKALAFAPNIRFQLLYPS